MAEKYIPVKDKTYKQNETILAVICISIIAFLAGSILWMIFDYGWMLAVSLFSLILIGVMFVLILLRRKKGIYLIEDHEMEYYNREADEKKRVKLEKQRKIENHKDNTRRKKKTPARLK